MNYILAGAARPQAVTEKIMDKNFVGNPDDVRENVATYLRDVQSSTDLRDGMAKVKAWYGFETSPGEWRFGPSKFVGYRGNDAETFVARRDFRDGGKTESILRKWFEEVPESDSRWHELNEALAAFLAAHGRKRPNARARICILKLHLREALRAPANRRRSHGRVRVDPEICGGRPHISGTRVRVSDILGMLAEGARPEEIVMDFPYLSEGDIHAALAFGAAAADHLVIDAA